MWLAVALVAFLAAPASIEAKAIRVVATIPDLADITEQVGGDLVKVSSLSTGKENIHSVPMKPSFVSRLNRADVVILLGLDAEHAFLPALLKTSKNPGIMYGSDGYIDCSVYLKPLNVPTVVDKSEGDLHPRGNPHYNLDPLAGKLIVKAIRDGLAAKYPEHETEFKARADEAMARIDAKRQELEKLAEPLKGLKVVTYHRYWAYFCQRYGMEVVGEIEYKPGIEPAPTHLVSLVNTMKKEGCKIIIKANHFPDKFPKFVAEKTGAVIVEVPVCVGGMKNAATYIDFTELLVSKIAEAAKDLEMHDPQQEKN
ncbi:metal ABC transporter substrate-binding protein [Candidatus Hydrogenedentota bacterium]